MKFDLTQSDKDQAFAPKEDFGFLDYAGDILAAPVRGIAGAAEGVYDLADWVFQDWLPDAEDNFGLGHSKTLAGGLVEGMSQFLTGFVPVFGQLGKASQALGWAGKAGKLAKAGKGTQWAANFGKSTLAGAVADATVFDAHEQRLSNLLNQFPSLKNPVSEYLAADENDSEFEGRIKNMIEGGVLGFAMEPFIMGLRSMKAGRAAKLVGGDPEKAANKANKAARTRKVQEKMPHLSLDEAQTADAAAISKGTDILDDTVPLERGEGSVEASAPQPLDQTSKIPTGASKPPDHPVNLDKFSDVEGAEAIIDSAVRTGSTEFQEGLEAVAKLPHEEIKSQARILSSEFEIVSGAKGLTDDAIENLDNSDELARIVAEQNMLRGYYQEYIRVADDFAEKALTGDDASKVLFMAARQRAEQVGLVVKRNQEKFGQGLNAQRIEGTDMVPKANLMPESAVSDPKYVADYLSDLGGGDATKGTIQVNEIIKRYQAAKAAHDDAGGIKYLRDTVKYSDMLVEYWINSILSGPITHMVNISSNFMNTLFMPLERAMGKALTLQGKEASKELGMYVHLFSQLQDAGASARSAFKNWGDPLDAMGKLDAERSMDRAIDSKNLPLATKTIGDTATNFIGKLLNTPSRFLMAEDAFFKHLNYRATVRQGLFREAMGDSSVRGGMSIGEYVETNLAKMVNEGQFYTYKNVRQQAEKAAQAQFAKITDPAEKASKVRASVFRFMKNNWNKEHGNMAKKAREYGREITYTKSLDDPSRSKLVNAAGGFNKWVNDYPMLRLISPFVRTPTNLLAFYLNRSVGAMAELGKYGTTSIMGKSSKDLAGAMAKGGQELDDILGRISTGAMFTFGAVMAVEGGNLTGGGPADPERRRMMEANGWQPYSVRVGDKWMSYRRFDPFANFFGLVADISESINESTPEEAGTLEAIMGHVIFAGSRNVMSKSYLTGIARFANVLTQPERYSENYIETTAASMMPFSGLAGQTIGSSDYHKEVRGVLDAMRSKYGLTSATDLQALGMDTKVEDRRNIFGDKLERPNLLLPLPVHQTQIKGDKVLNEISSLNHGFSPPKKDVNGIDTTLYFNNKGQSFYDRWQENHGKVRVGGRTLKQALKSLVSSGRYQRLDDKDIEGQGNPRVAEVQKLIRKYRAKALDQSLREFPEVEELYRRNTKIKSYRKAGRDITSLLNY